MSTVDPENESVRIYISPDKAPKQRREEQLTKRLVKSFEKVHPNGAPFYQPRYRAVCSAKKPIAKIEAKSCDDHKLVWNHEALPTSGIDKKKVEEHWRSISGTAPEITWSV